MNWLLSPLRAYAELALGCRAYSFQTFSVGQVLTAAQMSQVEVNIRDHVHGTANVAIGKQPTRTVLTSGSGTYTTPTGASRLLVRCVGPGGGGQGGIGANQSGESGGAGGYCEKVFVAPAASYSYVVGAGGAGGAAGAAGGTGAATTFGTLSAGAGAGGNGASYGSGAPGGTVVSGDINVTGNAGSPDLSLAGADSIAGPGGPWGGGAPGARNASGNNATGPGGAGSGGVNNTVGGGNGYAGIIIIDEYYD